MPDFKYGDRLKAVLQKMEDQTKKVAEFANVPFTSVAGLPEVSDLTRELNELWERDTILQKYFPVGVKDLEIPGVLNGSWYGSMQAASQQDIPNNVSTTLTTAWASFLESPDSVVRFYDQSTGKFDFHPAFVKKNSAFSVSGAVIFTNNCTTINPGIEFRKKSDDSLLGGWGLGQGGLSGKSFSFNWTASNQDSYFSSTNMEDAYMILVVTQISGADNGIWANVMFSMLQ